MSRNALCADLVRAADLFLCLGLWDEVHPQAVCAVELPELDGPLFACVMGQGGESYGLTVLRGPRAQQQLHELMNGDEEDASNAVSEDLAEEMDYLAFSAERFGEITPESAQLLAAGGWTDLAPNDPVPAFLVKPAHHCGRAPDEEDARQLLYVLSGILAAYNSGAFDPAPARPGEPLLTLTLSGAPEDPSVHAEHRRHAVPPEPAAPRPPAWAWSLNNLPRCEETWIVAWPNVPARIESDPRSMRVLLLVDRASQFVYQGKPLMSDETDSAVELLGQTFLGENLAEQGALPQRVLFSSKALYRAVAPALEAAGVPCEYHAVIPELEELVDHLRATFSGETPEAMPDEEEMAALEEQLRQDPHAAEAIDEIIQQLRDDPRAQRKLRELLAMPSSDSPEDEAPEVMKPLQRALDEMEDELDEEYAAPARPPAYPLDWDEIPDDADLDAWKTVARALGHELRYRAHSDGRFAGSRAAKRYFRDEDLDYFLEEFGKLQAEQAYVYWFFLSYRGTKKSKTPGEKLLEEDELPAAAAALLRSLAETHPSIYRVASHDAAAGTVTLEDILLGGQVTVHDREMSASCEDGWVCAAWCHPAGTYRFLVPAGPWVNELGGSRMVDVFQTFNPTLTREGLLAEAHKLGWLWDWLDVKTQQPDEEVELCNTDGDELLLHTAAFSVIRPEPVRKALQAREDIEHDPEQDEFVWRAPAAADSPVLGDTVTLGRIELLDDELVLTVNSAERLARARKWLEKLPGVEFLAFTTRKWDEPTEQRPLDDTIAPLEEPEISDELAEELQNRIEGQYMAWLDQPLPVLEGKTPRQTCETAEGRRRVAVLIRSIPNPAGPVPMSVPRDRMLRELGLDD